MSWPRTRHKEPGKASRSGVQRANRSQPRFPPLPYVERVRAKGSFSLFMNFSLSKKGAACREEEDNLRFRLLFFNQ